MCRPFIAPLIVLGLAAGCASSTESAVNELLEQVRLGDPAAPATHADSVELVESTEAVPLWISALETDESVPARQWAARLLGRIGDPQAVPALTAALDGPREVREAAAVALLQIDEQQAEAAFIATLPDASRDVQLLCLVELEKLQSVDAVPVIAEIARSPDTLLADNAVAALGGIGAAAAASRLPRSLPMEASRIRSASQRSPTSGASKATRRWPACKSSSPRSKSKKQKS